MIKGVTCVFVKTTATNVVITGFSYWQPNPNEKPDWLKVHLKTSTHRQACRVVEANLVFPDGLPAPQESSGLTSAQEKVPRKTWFKLSLRCGK